MPTDPLTRIPRDVRGWAECLARWLLAAVFLYAGITKAADPATFARQIHNYHLMPWWAVHPVAILLPWLEITASVLLVPGIWVVEAASLLAGLTVLFIAAVGWALYRKFHIPCGCFGRDGMVSWLHIISNVGLLLLMGSTILLHRTPQSRGKQCSSQPSVAHKPQPAGQ